MAQVDTEFLAKLAAAAPGPDAAVQAGAPFNVSSAAVLWQGSVAGYGSIDIYASAIPSGAFIALEGTLDGGANWGRVPLTYVPNLYTTSNPTFDTIPAVGLTRASTFGNVMRLRVVAYTSGVVTVPGVMLRTSPWFYPPQRTA